MSSPFIHDGFLLHNPPARRLYDSHAAPQPIFDYHSHLPPRETLKEALVYLGLHESWIVTT